MKLEKIIEDKLSFKLTFEFGGVSVDVKGDKGIFKLEYKSEKELILDDKIIVKYGGEEVDAIVTHVGLRKGDTLNFNYKINAVQ